MSRRPASPVDKYRARMAAPAARAREILGFAAALTGGGPRPVPWAGAAPETDGFEDGLDEEEGDDAE